MSALFGNKNIKDIFFGNKAVVAIYRGNKLVWQKVVKHLVSLLIRNQCIEFIPTEDITLQNISFLGQYNDTNARFRVFNEVGLCIAFSAENGIQTDVTIYSLNGTLKTSTNTFGTPILYAGQKYYINVTGLNGTDMTSAKYDGLTTNMKIFNNVSNINSAYSQDAWTHKCDGSASSFEEICQKENNCYFIWRGSALPNNMKPNEGGENNPYPYLLNRDMSKVKCRFTDSDFNALSDDMTRYAYVFYKMGSTQGDEFVMNTEHWNKGFNINGTTVLGNNKNHIYTLNWCMASNHITSMTPVDDEPAVKNDLDVYFKSANSKWGDISGKAVVIWHEGQWKIATSWDAEFLIDSTYDATNYVTKIDNSYAKDFNNVSVTNGDKLYYRINGVEIF